METILSKNPPDYKTLCNNINSLGRAFPFLRIGLLGHSLCRRRIYALRLGRAPNPIVIAAGFHAQEWITTLVLLRFAQCVCACAQNRSELCGTDIGSAISRREIIFVPCVNPDGIEIALNGAATAGCYSPLVSEVCAGDLSSWNANARGVDMNHNFNAGWQISRELEKKAGIDSPAPRRYGGEHPESEPEARALADLCRSRLPRSAFALHSQGEEIFYSYGRHTPQRSTQLARIFAAASGYELVENSGLYSHAGFKDWFIEEFHRPAFTFELGKGKNPLPLSDLDDIYSKIEQTLVFACIM